MSVRNPPANEQLVSNGFCTHRWLLWFNDLLYGHVGDATTLDGVAAAGYALAAHTHTGTYAPAPVFVPVAWDGGRYTGVGGGGWSVTAGNQTTFGYWLDGDRLTLAWHLDSTTTTTAPTALSIALPASYTAVRAVGGCHAYQTATGGWEVGSVDIAASGAVMLLYTRTRLAWPSESGTVLTRGQITLEVA
jgi:hypothetical protein